MKAISKFAVIIGLSVFLLTAAGKLFAAEQTLCPVMGGKISYNLFSDYKGKRIYFCCPVCKPAFESNPEQYMKKLKDMGQEPIDIPE